MSEIVDPPRLESLHIENYRALRDITLKKLTPLTVAAAAATGSAVS